jgi:LuxR family maltose regulon positive regulatory protein
MNTDRPIIRDGILTAQEPTGEIIRIPVGSEAWFVWLEQAAHFVFDDAVGHFSARKKRRGRGGYWYSPQRRKGKLRDVYLGKSASITMEKLRAFAAMFSALGQSAALALGLGMPTSRPSHPLFATATSERQDLQDLQELLQAKTTVPQIQIERVVPTRARALLDGALRRRLTVVDAPAGYGKTTLLAHWIEVSGVAAAWVTLDQGHNDPSRFWTYLVVALDRVASGLCDKMLPLVRAGNPQHPDTIVAALVHNLAALPDPTVLVFDDFHEIRGDNARLLHLLDLLLERLPAQVRCVVVGRAQPDISLGLIRVHDQLLELHADQLAFTSAEVATLLRQDNLPDLAIEQVEEVHRQTEGWVVGVKLAARALQHTTDSTRSLAGLGQERFVSEFIGEAVLRHVPEEVRSYLSQVSVLDRLCAPLCDAVTRRHDGHAMLAELTRRDLFIMALDPTGEWYRFHPLFAAALRRELSRSHPELVPKLYARASAWCAATGRFRNAIDYAFAGNDLARAAHLIERYLPDAQRRGRFVTLREYIDRLPRNVVCERPRLCLAYAYTLIMVGDRALVAECLCDAEAALDRAADMLDPAERAVLRAELAVLRTDLQSHLGQSTVQARIAAYTEALAALPAKHVLRLFALLRLGIEHVLDGDVRAACAALGEHCATSAARGDVFYYFASLLPLGGALQQSGRLDEAVELCLHPPGTLNLAAYGDATISSVKDLILGQVLYERNELDAAVDHLLASRVLPFAPAAALIDGLPTLAYAYLARGESAAAQETIEHARVTWEQSEGSVQGLWQWTGDIIAAHHARLCVMHGELEPASQWARQLVRRRRAGMGSAAEREPPAYLREWESMVLAHVYLAEGKPGAARDLLWPLAAAADSAGRVGRLIEILILQALAHKAMGDLDAALDALGRAVELAEPARYIRTFVDAGPAVQPLLSLLTLTMSIRTMAPFITAGPAMPVAPARRRGEVVRVLDYLGTLLAAFPGPAAATPAFATDASSDARQVPDASVSSEPLGQRSAPTPLSASGPADVQTRPAEAEIEFTTQQRRVLKALARGASDKEIGTQLGIKASTAKTHVHRVVSKLGALNRAHAVAIAMAQHLIDPFAEPDGDPPDPEPIAVRSSRGNSRSRRSSAFA